MNIVYYHYWIPDDFRSLYWYWQLDEQCRHIVESGLIDNAVFYINITMPQLWTMDVRSVQFEKSETREPVFFKDKVVEYLEYRYPFFNISLRDTGNQENLYEGATLSKLHEMSKKNPEANYFYFHSKGVSSASAHSKMWFDSLNQIMISDWRKCLSVLQDENCNVVGVKDSIVKKDSNGLSHLSGNYFWAKGKYLSTLDIPYYEKNRYEYEKWIISGDKHGERIRFIYDLGVDPFVEYVSEPNKIFDIV